MRPGGTNGWRCPKGQSDEGRPDEDMGFPPELQEAILIWNIATNVFLSYSSSSSPSPRITREESKEQAKVIEQMSDYMMFLVANRPEMLPGLTLHSLHERARCAVVEIWKVAKPTSHTTKKKDVVAMWMLENRDYLNDPNFGEGIQNIEKSYLEGPGMTIVRAGTELAGELLGKPSKGGESKINKEVTDMVKGLEHWIPDLQKLPSKEIAGMVKGPEHWDMKDMLKFILEAWVRLLMFASMRCSRDSHAKRLSCGGELTTLIWIITEHTKNSVVKDHLQKLFR